jgi:hypothetical protein
MIAAKQTRSERKGRGWLWEKWAAWFLPIAEK